MLGNKEDECDYFKGFVDWHNKRTVNSIDEPRECQCNLKDDWRKLKEKNAESHNNVN